MAESTTESVKFPGLEAKDVMTEILQEGAQRMLAQAIQEEVEEWIGQRAHLRDGQGRQHDEPEHAPDPEPDPVRAHGSPLLAGIGHPAHSPGPDRESKQVKERPRYAGRQCWCSGGLC